MPDLQSAKILIVHPQFETYGGAERVVVRLANYLSSRRIPHLLVTANIPTSIARHLTDTRIIATGSLDRLAQIIHFVLDDFDVINAHNSPAHLLHLPSRKPVLWLCNEPPFQYLKTGELSEREIQLTRDYIDQIVVADEFNRQRIRKIYDLDATVIHYGIDTEFFLGGGSRGEYKAISDRYRLPDDAFFITQVAWLTFTKNQVRTVDIFARVREKIPNAHLILIGKFTGYRTEVETQAREHGVLRHITFTGNLSRQDLRTFYGITDIAIMPIGPQGGWLSVFEAIGAGVPIAVSKEMTASSIIEEHNLAPVCYTDDDFVDFIVHSKCPQAHPHASEWVEHNLTWDKFCSSITRQCLSL